MRRISIKNLKGNEILAQDIMSEYDTLLMSQGVVIKKEYIERLEQLGITHLYVDDSYAEGIEEITELKIKSQCQKEVQNTLDKYLSCGSSELEQIKDVAKEIILDLLESPEIMFNVSGVRQKAESAYSHSINVAALSVFIALQMKISKEKVREIAIGALLHDIGYTCIRTEIKEKKYIEFTDAERKEMKMHVVHGYTVMKDEKWLTNTAKNIIFHHHERIDGTGYPMHLKGDKQKIAEKIVAVCDAFDRKIYGIYADQMKVHEAMEYIVGNSGKLFDSSVVEIFNKSVAAYPNGTTVVTNQGEEAIVYRQNKGMPTRPVLRMLKDASGKDYENWIEKDLVKELSIFIQDTLE